MKSTYAANLLLLHVIVLVWGLTGILGKEISLSAVPLVWWRVLIATVTIGIIIRFAGLSVQADKRSVMRFMGVGLITAAHWICFFAAIKYSKISVALVVLSTSAFFVSIVSPYIRREKLRRYEVWLGLVVIVGLAMIFNFESAYTTGIILALLAAMLAAIFSTINSTLAARHEPSVIAFWEMLSAWFGLSLFMAFSGGYAEFSAGLTGRDLGLLLVLGVLCTGVAFIVSIKVMRVLSPFTCALAINLEPVYTILIALALYGESEYMSGPFYLGAAIILSTLFIDARLKRAQRKKATIEGGVD